MINRSERCAARCASPPSTAPVARCARYFSRPPLRAVALAAMLAVAACFAALPAYAYVGDVHNVIETGWDQVSAPDVAYDWWAGEYLVAWQDDYWNDGTDMDPWVRAFYPDGTPATDPVCLAWVSYNDYPQKVASIGYGSWLVAWVRHYASYDELHGTIVDYTGAVGSDTVYFTTAADQHIPSLDVGGTLYDWYLIVFDVENASGDGDIRSALVAYDGSLYWTDAVSVSGWDDYECSVDQIGVDFLVAWTWYNPGDGSTSILGRQVSGYDGSMGSEFAIHYDLETSGAPSVASDANYPDLFLVTYGDEWWWPDYDIGYAFVSGGVVESTGPFYPAYTGAYEYQSSASFTGLTDTFFVAWSWAYDIFSPHDILASYLQRDGSFGGTEYLAIDPDLSEARFQSTCLWTGIGNVAAVWDQWWWDTGDWDTSINERDWSLMGPNLRDDGAEYQYFDPTSVVPGTPWSVGCDVRNDGAVASKPCYVFTYASTDTVLDVFSDYYLGLVEMPAIAAGDWADCDWSGLFPGIPAGTYWVFWYIDALDNVDEDNEGDNVTYLSAYQLTVGEAVNLHDDGALYQSFSPTAVGPGDTWSVSCDIRNAGNVASGPFAVQVYASTDTTIDTSDYLLGEVAMADLAANNWADCDWTGPFPATVPGGTYWVGWIIDPANVVPEGNEEDNTTYLEAYQLTVEAPPMAAFSGTPTSGLPGLVVAFTDASTGVIDSWAWDFGDGGNATDQNPSHTYATAGSFDVSLTVTNTYGPDTETKLDYIQVIEPIAADFSATPTAGILPLEVSFTDLSTGIPTAWAWDFGDGTTATVKNPTHTYTDPGYYTVTLTASKTGATDTESKVGFIAVGFTDTAPGDSAFYEILACVQAGVVQGYWNQTYRPALSVSRGQMAIYIARAVAGGESLVPDPPPGTQTFPDVDSENGAYKYVEYCFAQHVVQGFGDGTYKPDKMVNRGQMAMYVARGLVAPLGDAGVPIATGDPTFPDVTPDGAWAQCFNHVEYLAGLGVVQGFWDLLYHPEREVRRDQMALYVQRAFDLPIYPQ